jgi:hypothetical protein
MDKYVNIDAHRVITVDDPPRWALNNVVSDKGLQPCGDDLGFRGTAFEQNTAKSARTPLKKNKRDAGWIEIGVVRVCAAG